MTDHLSAAHAYARRGWRVTPLHHVNDRGVCTCRLGVNCSTPGKHPIENAWQTTASASGADVQSWWEQRPAANVGIATGPGSGFWVLDIDPDKGGLVTLSSLIAEHGPMPATRVHRTGSGGMHYLFAWPDFTVRNSSDYLGPGIDTRGLNGQVVAPPSHSSKGDYAVLSDVEVLPAPEWLLERMREHAEHAERGIKAETVPAIPVDIESIPVDVRQLLSQVVGEDEGRFRHFYNIIAACRRAGYKQGEVVTLITPWCRAVDKYVGRIGAEVARAWGKLQAEEDNEREWLTSLAPVPQDTTSVTLQAPQQPSGIVEIPELPEPERTSWWPKPLSAVIAGDHEEPEPDFLTRLDGRRLFYRGKINGLLGESESGKTWVALLAVVQAIVAGERVLYLDFEDTAPGIVGRLKAMSADDAALDELLRYTSPEEAMHLAASNDLRQTLEQHKPGLVVLDGFNAAMTLLGLDLDNNRDATKFSQMLLRPLANTGACVVYVDHVPKNKDNRGKGGIGAQAKRAMTTGCAVAVEVVQPFGRGMKGRLRLLVDKDRPGRVRESCPDAKSIGMALIDSDALTGRVTVRLEASGAGTEVFELMEKISAALESGAVDNPSSRSLSKHLGKRQETVRDTLATMLGRGYVAHVGSGSQQFYRLVKPYSMADELTSTGPRPAHPTASRTRGAEDGSTASQPRPFRDEGMRSRQRVADALAIDPNTGEILDPQQDAS